MQGLRGQKIDWSGEDGAWYSLIKDDAVNLQVNVRLNAPLPDEFPSRQLITGMSVLSEGHSLVIEVKDPYSVSTGGCSDGIMFVWIVSAMTVTKVVEGCVYIRRRYCGILPRVGGEFEHSALSPLSHRSLSRSVL